MAKDKFEPSEDISEVEIKLECLRLATEFGPENDRRDPLPIAENYFKWVMQNSKRQSEKTASKKDKVKS